MRLWRVSAHRGFDGEGARLFGGRWNHPGTRVVYAAATLALAVLEFLAHVDRDLPPADLIAHHVDVPDEARTETLDETKLPRDWRAYPSPPLLRDIGTRWAAAGSSLLLRVPSAVLGVEPELVVGERNYLINPAHAEFKRVRPRALRLPLDPRLWR